MINSVNNETIKKYAKLQQKKYRNQEKLFLIEGINLINEAKMENILVDCYTTNPMLPGTLVNNAVMAKLSQTASPPEIIGVCRKKESQIISKRILILEDIQDPGNLGTLLRSACSFGFTTIFLSDNTVDLYNSKVIRASQGALFKLNFHFGNPIEFIKKLKTLDYHILVTDVQNGQNIINPKYEQIALVLGNEGHGVSLEVKALSDTFICLKLQQMESLNVAVAGSIIMYEIDKPTINL